MFLFQYTLSQETIDYVKQPTFDIWHWEPNEVRCVCNYISKHLNENILNCMFITMYISTKRNAIIFGMKCRQFAVSQESSVCSNLIYF